MIKRLLSFLDASPVNFLAVKNISGELEKNGFRRVNPQEPLGKIEAGDKFFVTKNDSSIYAFQIGKKPLADAGFHMICAHCDSPTFRIKPNAEMLCEGGIVKLNTEVYGGPIMSTWFDRPLTLAGRVIVKGENAMNPQTLLLHVKRPLLQISNLAIHFNRNVNAGNPLSKQKDMLPIAAIVSDSMSKNNFLIDQIKERLEIADSKDILDFDLMLYNCQKSQLVGFNKEFICSGRIDDLSMAHAALSALLNSDNPATTKVMAIFDNEETGSGTKQGAASPVLASILHRVSTCMGLDDEGFYQALSRSFLVSADNAHAAHPNYPEKYDPTNHPKMGGGPVIKINANCKYMTDAHSSAIFKEVCHAANVPCQYFSRRKSTLTVSTSATLSGQCTRPWKQAPSLIMNTQFKHSSNFSTQNYSQNKKWQIREANLPFFVYP